MPSLAKERPRHQRGAQGQGPSKKRLGPGKNNWTVHVKKSKKTKW